MKKIFMLMGIGLLFVFIPGTIYSSPLKTTLSGKITDKKSGNPLPGVTIYIADLKTGSVTDIDGKYLIENLPQTKVALQVSLIGYKNITVSIDLSATTSKDFMMEESVNELHEVVVTGLSVAGEKNRTATPIETMSSIQLQRISATNIIDAVATQPGISQVTTGAGISKPVIRGLGYNRVVVVNDGIRQEGQQWGDEHGIEVDEFAVKKVEILKGPASLSYGSDAMAGVINFISAPTLPSGKIEGSVIADYQTNNGLAGFSGNIAGNLKGFIWDVRYSNKISHAYHNRYDGYVFNSGFKENSTGGIIGLNKAWGYSHLHFSVYNFTPGIIEGERDNATGRFVKPVAINDSTAAVEIVSDHDLKAYNEQTPFQKIHHYKAVLNNSFIAGNGSIKAIVGWQQNQRQEFADILNKGNYGLFFLLNTINYDARYIFPEKNNFNLSIGINGMQQTSQNKGVEFLVPEYNLFDAGVFAIVKKTFDKLDISGGLRYDSRTEKGKNLFLDSNGKPASANDPGVEQKFIAFKANYSGLSGSVGATYQISEIIYTKLNISRGFRAPNIAEAGANGVHEGTIRYEIGDPHLSAENSLQGDFALGINSDHISAEADLFLNHINHFIFPRKLNSISGGDSISEGYQVFKYFSTNADLTGGEVSVDIHPHPFDWLHFENSFSYVQSEQRNQPDSMKYLPFTPAPKISSELRADIRKINSVLKNSYLKIGLDAWFDQRNVYSAYGTESPTPGYVLMNAGAGTDFIHKGKVCCSIYITANNIGDVGYQSHLSRLKYGETNNLNGRNGVYNMGRNVSFKIIIPVIFKT